MASDSHSNGSGEPPDDFLLKAFLRLHEAQQNYLRWREAEVRSLLPEMTEEQARYLAERLTQILREGPSPRPESEEAEPGTDTDL